MIRSAVQSDLDAIEKIYNKIHEQEEQGTMTVGWLKGVYPVRATAEAALERGDLFVLEQDGNVAASAVINHTQVPEYADCSWKYPASESEIMVLHTLTVDPDQKGKGCGRAFVQFYEEYALRNGCEYLRMDTQSKNTAARDFYKKLGYKEPGMVYCTFNGIPDVELVCLEKKLCGADRTDNLRSEAEKIIDAAVRAVQPDAAVRRALEHKTFEGRIVLAAIGKAAWQMAKAASDRLGEKISKGVVVTKYGHVMGTLPRIDCYEAGHPIPDENSFRGTEAVLEAVEGLTDKDTVLFLVSGGGSALFEKPLVSGEELREITAQLLACGADIVEMNTIRKRLSGVKGGRFALACRPASVYSIILSDILGDPLDMIASGPACPDSSTCEDALAIVEKYGLQLSEKAMELLKIETPESLDNVETQINGSVRELCRAAADACSELGYETVILTDQLCCQAKEAGSFLASVVKTHAGQGKKLAFLAGGETVVKLTGKGLGGRNQELALAAAEGITGLDAAVFSVGSDGTDGPTDAAGGYVDGTTAAVLREKNISIPEVLKQNDAYHALEASGGLIITGPTGTNVNDVAAALIKG